MAEAQAAHTGAGTPAVSLPTTPSSAALDSSPSESPSGGILPSRRNATQPTDLLSSIAAIFRLRSARSVGQETAHHRDGGHVLVFLIQQSAGTCAQAREGTPPRQNSNLGAYLDSLGLVSSGVRRLWSLVVDDLFRVQSGTPTFSQVASNAVWSGWKDEAFPTFEAAASSQGKGKKGANGAASGAKSKDKKKVLLFSNANSRRS